MNAIKGEANVVNRRRTWAQPARRLAVRQLVGRPTFDAMQSAVRGVAARLPPVDAGQGAPARHAGGLPWCDLVAPAAGRAGRGHVGRGHRHRPRRVRELQPAARRARRPGPRRAVDRRRATRGQGRRRVLHAVRRATARSCCSTGRAASTRRRRPRTSSATPTTTRTLAERTALQRRLPMALAETASIFCETLVVEDGARAGSTAPSGSRCSTSTCVGATQVVVDIHSRFLFETEVFARRQQRTLGVGELNELMLAAAGATPTATASTSRRRTRTCGRSSRTTTARTSTTGRTRTACCSGSACSPATRTIPSGSAPATTTLLSRAGMDTAEELGRVVRPRRHRRGVLDRQPRRDPRPHGRLRAARADLPSAEPST